MAHFRYLQLREPSRGYFPEPTKSILVVAERNVPRSKDYFRGMGIQVVTGSQYLGGFIGERETCIPIPRKYSLDRGTFRSATTKMLLVGSGKYPRTDPLSWRSLKWAITSPNFPT